MSKNTRAKPVSTDTTTSWVMFNAPSAAATGMVASSIPLVTSLAMRMGRRRNRSSQAPAGRPMRANASVEEAVIRPTWNGVALSDKTASRGIATPLTWAPIWLVVWPRRRRPKLRDTNSEPPVTGVPPGAGWDETHPPGSTEGVARGRLTLGTSAWLRQGAGLMRDPSPAVEPDQVRSWHTPRVRAVAAQPRRSS